jgi:hypothetical protein
MDARLKTVKGRYIVAAQVYSIGFGLFLLIPPQKLGPLPSGGEHRPKDRFTIFSSVSKYRLCVRRAGYANLRHLWSDLDLRRFGNRVILFHRCSSICIPQ